MEIRALILNQSDNVAVVVQEAKEGDTVRTEAGDYIAAQTIKTGHKIAIKAIGRGENIIKYGFAIGKASENINPGDWVHTHNVTDNTEELCNDYAVSYRAKVREAEGK